MAVDPAGNAYLSTLHQVVEAANGALSVLAGGGTESIAPGVAGTSINFSGSGLAAASNGTIYFSANNQVWRLVAVQWIRVDIFSKRRRQRRARARTSECRQHHHIVRQLSLNSPASAGASPLPTTLAGVSIQVGSGR